MIYIWLAILTLIATVLWVFCRRETFFDKPRNGYVVFNNLTGNAAMDGRVFKTENGAVKAVYKLCKGSIIASPGMFHIKKVNVE